MRTWRPKGRSRERILCFGVQGTGKSHAALSIMLRCPADTFYVIDNDNAWDRQLENTELEDQVKEEYRGSKEKTVRGGDKTVELIRDHEYENPNGRIILYHVQGWLENIAAIKDAVSRAGRNDWIVVDSVTQLWDNVAEWYVDEIFDKDIDKYFMQVRQEKEKKGGDKGSNLGALEGWMDYGVINPVYAQNVTKHLLNPPCHLFMTAEQTEVTKMDKDKDIKGLFGPFGVKPKGQKRTGHNPQTVMLMTVLRSGEWKMSTVKDRGTRTKVIQADVEEFAKDYLYRIGGWRVTDVD